MDFLEDLEHNDDELELELEVEFAEWLLSLSVTLSFDSLSLLVDEALSDNLLTNNLSPAKVLFYVMQTNIIYQMKSDLQNRDYV